MLIIESYHYHYGKSESFGEPEAKFEAILLPSRPKKNTGCAADFSSKRNHDSAYKKAPGAAAFIGATSLSVGTAQATNLKKK